MATDWDNRARQDAYHFAASDRDDWTTDSFLESGRQSVAALLLEDLDRIAPSRGVRDLRLLEIGCGPGRMTYWLARHFGTVVGVDVSAEMLTAARKILRAQPNALLCRTNGCDLSMITSACIDVAFSFIVFQHIPTLQVLDNYMSECYRVLRPGGILKVQVQGARYERRMTLDTWYGVSVSAVDVMRWITTFGFDLVDSVGAGTQYFWLWLRKPHLPRDLRQAMEFSHLQEVVAMLCSELESLRCWSATPDPELLAAREYLRSLYVSPAYRLGRRLRLAPEPFRFDPVPPKHNTSGGKPVPDNE